MAILISQADLLHACKGALVNGQHMILDSLLDTINTAQAAGACGPVEHGFATAFRAIVESARKTLPHNVPIDEVLAQIG